MEGGDQGLGRSSNLGQAKLVRTENSDGATHNATYTVARVVAGRAAVAVRADNVA